MRILITGAGGQVGHALVAACAADDTTAADHRLLDVADRDAVLAAVTSLQPDAVLHTAAWTAVDACEADPDRAFAVNALGTRNVAEAAGHVGAHLLYCSTDYVFDGAKESPYLEWDPPNPQSVYGRSKLAGELEAHGLPGSTIVRLSWVCGEHGANMVKTVLRLASERDELAFVDDQRGHPTFAESVAPLIRRLVGERRPGLFHVTNQGVVSWFDFARAVFEAAGLDEGRIRPIATAELDPPRPAPRPVNSVLDNAALRLGGVPLAPDFHAPLQQLVDRLTHT
ncbi:MAG TPA: dTDP-4-dehydrorhamnose reductase [Acidimicrobiia bacterium]|nr:dTDP-4-dehydrorhamnose reductase [Acidimicrobiia bacterium]